MKLKDLIEQYGEYEVSKTKSDWCDAGHITLELNKPKPKTVWDLEHGDEYVRITGTGGVSECEVCTKITYDRQRDVGNVFLTKEEAEKDTERRKVETLLLKYGGHRWAREGINYRLGLQYNMVVICKDMYPLQGAIYFDLEQEAQKAIDEIGEDRIKRALFEVK